MDLFGEGSDVLQILTNICAAAVMEIKIEPLNSCSLRAARIQRSDFDALYTYINIINIYIGYRHWIVAIGYWLLASDW